MELKINDYKIKLLEDGTLRIEATWGSVVIADCTEPILKGSVDVRVNTVFPSAIVDTNNFRDIGCEVRIKK